MTRSAEPAGPGRTSEKPIAFFAWFVLAFNVFVVLWGALVRATKSGAGCGAHWPTCNGDVIPLAPTMATLIEFTHRATSGLALLLVVALLVLILRRRPAGRLVRPWAAASMALILSEAAIGAGLVLYKKVAEDTSLSRGLWISGHLINTFLLLAALALTAHLVDGRRSATSSRPLDVLRSTFAVQDTRRWLGFAIIALIATGVSGAIAALGDTLFKVESLRDALVQDVAETSHLFIRLRVFHPVIAIVGGLIALALTYRSAVALSASRGRTWARVVSGLVVFQWILGLTNLLLLAPTALQLAHLLVADLIWISLILFAAGEPD